MSYADNINFSGFEDDDSRVDLDFNFDKSYELENEFVSIESLIVASIDTRMIQRNMTLIKAQVAISKKNKFDMTSIQIADRNIAIISFMSEELRFSDPLRAKALRDLVILYNVMLEYATLDSLRYSESDLKALCDYYAVNYEEFFKS